jgi:hypothetical protein
VYREWGSFNGHFAFKSNKYKGLGEIAFQVSNRTVVEHEQSSSSDKLALRQAVQAFVRGLPDRLRESIDETDIELCLRRQDVRRRLDSGAAADERAGELGAAVQLVRQQLRGAVISEIDKERGMNFIM